MSEHSIPKPAHAEAEVHLHRSFPDVEHIKHQHATTFVDDTNNLNARDMAGQKRIDAYLDCSACPSLVAGDGMERYR